MNNFTKISLSLLLSFFLTACDKAASQTGNQHLEQQTQDVDSPKNEAIKIDVGLQDYKTLIEWQSAQEKTLNDAIKNATNKLTGKQKADPALMQETVNQTLLAQIENIKTSAEALNIQTSEIKMLKDKTIEVLTLGTQMIIEGAKMAKNPTPEAHKAFADLQTKLNQLAEEGQQLENQLKTKYAPPAPQ